MKTTDIMYEMKDTLDGINGRLDTAKEKTDELESRHSNNNQNETQ